ncbi:hypothetical protein EVAR_83217_1 [Eumeta japonica]|uniref:Uncharacterized protein n=1 Tax=Eumeta variegata TaxID=151549 RepID=A0A4C1Y5S1_EUMVA|nr:hypothetical protein EVAR_83217_1 [Eumeta japonica]
MAKNNVQTAPVQKERPGKIKTSVSRARVVDGAAALCSARGRHNSAIVGRSLISTAPFRGARRGGVDPPPRRPRRRTGIETLTVNNFYGQRTRYVNVTHINFELRQHLDAASYGGGRGRGRGLPHVTRTVSFTRLRRKSLSDLARCVTVCCRRRRRPRAVVREPLRRRELQPRSPAPPSMFRPLHNGGPLRVSAYRTFEKCRRGRRATYIAVTKLSQLSGRRPADLAPRAARPAPPARPRTGTPARAGP